MMWLLFLLSIAFRVDSLLPSTPRSWSQAARWHAVKPAKPEGMASELKIRVGETLKPLNPQPSGGIFVGGPTNSIDMYACQPETLDLTAGHIYAWAMAERLAIRDVFTHGIVLGSLDRRRVVHITGFDAKLTGTSLFYTFEDFKKRADSAQGTPASLKESTHTYTTIGQYPPRGLIDLTVKQREKYPFFTVDIFTLKRKEQQNDLVGIFHTGMSTVAASAKAPKELVSWHLLKSTDSLVCALIGAWGPGPDPDGDPTLGPAKLLKLQGYQDALKEAAKLAIPGSYTDIMEKTNPLERMYFICEVISPYKPGDDQL